jgi:hypothetical protein
VPELYFPFNGSKNISMRALNFNPGERVMSPRWKKQLSTWWVLRNIEFRDTPPAQYVDALGRDEYFSFARYGDGEWSAILGKPGGNCDGHEYFPELRERLAAAVRTPRGYYYALQRHAMRTLGFKIVSWIWYGTIPMCFTMQTVMAC